MAARGEFRALTLGSLRVWPPVVLAPMAGVTNHAFRSLCREFGAGLFVSEMITARGYLNGNARTRALAMPHEDERPRSIQIYGSDPVDLGEMVRILVDEGVDHLDLNLGCPVPKVTRAGGGSAIPAKPRLVARLVRAMVRSAGQVPVTVKMRKGLDDELITYLAAGRAAQDEGVAAVGLHARTAAQLYSAQADWQAIARLKSALDVPVLGNGDIWECWDALRMMRETGCDAVIVGRGCLGRPWLFRELAQVFEGEEPEDPPDLGQVRQVILDHARRLIALFGQDIGVKQMRKWMGWYTKGFRKSSALRRAAQRASTLAELEQVLSAMDPNQLFPLEALRVQRGKGARTQRVKLPQGYREHLDDDTPPRGPRCKDEVLAWERALGGG